MNNDRKIQELIAGWARSTGEEAPDFQSTWNSARERARIARPLVSFPIRLAVLFTLFAGGGFLLFTHSGKEFEAVSAPVIQEQSLTEWQDWHSGTDVLLSPATSGRGHWPDSGFQGFTASLREETYLPGIWAGPTDFLLRGAGNWPDRIRQPQETGLQPQT